MSLCFLDIHGQERVPKHVFLLVQDLITKRLVFKYVHLVDPLFSVNRFGSVLVNL